MPNRKTDDSLNAESYLAGIIDKWKDRDFSTLSPELKKIGTSLFQTHYDLFKTYLNAMGISPSEADQLGEEQGELTARAIWVSFYLGIEYFFTRREPKTSDSAWDTTTRLQVLAVGPAVYQLFGIIKELEDKKSIFQTKGC